MQDKIICRICGSEVNSDDRFFNKCGAALSEVADVPSDGNVPGAGKRRIVSIDKELFRQKKNNVFGIFYLVMSILLFALSFSPVSTYEYESLYGDIEVQVCSVDKVGFMFDIMHNQSSDELKNSLLYNKLQNKESQLNDAIYSADRLKEKRLTAEVAILRTKLQLRHKTVGALGMKVTVAVEALLSLAMIVSAFSLLIMSIISLVKAQQGKEYKHIRLRRAFFIHLTLMLLILFNTFNAAGALIAAMVFAALCCAAALIEGYVFNDTSNRRKHKTAAVLMCFLTIAVMFAPTMKLAVTEKNGPSIGVDNLVLRDSIYTEEIWASLDELSQERKKENIQSYYYNGIINGGSCEYKSTIAKELVGLCLVFYGGRASQVLTLGYYMYLAAMLLLGCMAASAAGALSEQSAKSKKNMKGLSAAMITLLVASLICSIACACMVSIGMDEYGISNAIVSVSAGSIAALILALATAAMKGGERAARKSKSRKKKTAAAAEPAADDAAAVL